MADDPPPLEEEPRPHRGPPTALSPLDLHPKVPPWFPRHEGDDEEAQSNWEQFCKNAVQRFEKDSVQGIGDPPEGFEQIRTEALRRLAMIQFCSLWTPYGSGVRPEESDPMNILDLFRAWDFDEQNVSPEVQQMVRAYLPADAEQQKVLRRAQLFDGDVALFADLAKRVSTGEERRHAIEASGKADKDYRSRWSDLVGKITEFLTKQDSDNLPLDWKAWVDVFTNDNSQHSIPRHRRLHENFDASRMKDMHNMHNSETVKELDDGAKTIVKKTVTDDGTVYSQERLREDAEPEEEPTPLGPNEFARPAANAPAGAFSSLPEDNPSSVMTQLQELRSMERALKNLVAAWTAPYTWFALGPTSTPDYGMQNSVENLIYETRGDCWVMQPFGNKKVWVSGDPKNREKWIRTGRVMPVLGPPLYTSNYDDVPAEQREDGLNKQLQTTREQAGKTTEQLYAEARKLLESEDWEAKAEGEEKLAALDMRWTWARTRGGGSFCHLVESDVEDWADGKGEQPDFSKGTKTDAEYQAQGYVKRVGPLYKKTIVEDTSSGHDDLLMLTGGPWWGLHNGTEWRINHLMMDGRISDFNKEVRAMGTDDTCLAFQTRRLYNSKYPHKPVEKEFPKEELEAAAAKDDDEYERLKANFLRYVTIREMDADYKRQMEKEAEQFKASKDLRRGERRRQREAAEAAELKKARNQKAEEINRRIAKLKAASTTSGMQDFLEFEWMPTSGREDPLDQKLKEEKARRKEEKKAATAEKRASNNDSRMRLHLKKQTNKEKEGKLDKDWPLEPEQDAFLRSEAGEAFVNSEEGAAFRETQTYKTWEAAAKKEAAAKEAAAAEQEAAKDAEAARARAEQEAKEAHEQQEVQAIVQLKEELAAMEGRLKELEKNSNNAEKGAKDAAPCPGRCTKDECEEPCDDATWGAYDDPTLPQPSYLSGCLVFMLRSLSLRLAERRRYDYWRMERWEFDFHQGNQEVMDYFEAKRGRTAGRRTGSKDDGPAFAEWDRVGDLAPYDVGVEMSLFLNGLIHRPVETFFANIANGRFFSFPDRLIRLYELGFEHRYSSRSEAEYTWMRSDCMLHLQAIKRLVVKIAYALHGQNAPAREEALWFRTDDRGWEHLPTEHVQVVAPLASEDQQVPEGALLALIRARIREEVAQSPEGETMKKRRKPRPFSPREQALMAEQGYDFVKGAWARIHDTVEEAKIREEWVQAGKYGPRTSPGDSKWGWPDENRPRIRDSATGQVRPADEPADGVLPRTGSKWGWQRGVKQKLKPYDWLRTTGRRGAAGHEGNPEENYLVSGNANDGDAFPSHEARTALWGRAYNYALVPPANESEAPVEPADDWEKQRLDFPTVDERCGNPNLKDHQANPARFDDRLIPVNPADPDGPTFQSPPEKNAAQRHCAGPHAPDWWWFPDRYVKRTRLQVWSNASRKNETQLKIPKEQSYNPGADGYGKRVRAGGAPPAQFEAAQRDGTQMLKRDGLKSNESKQIPLQDEGEPLSQRAKLIDPATVLRVRSWVRGADAPPLPPEYDTPSHPFYNHHEGDPDLDQLAASNGRRKPLLASTTPLPQVTISAPLKPSEAGVPERYLATVIMDLRWRQKYHTLNRSMEASAKREAAAATPKQDDMDGATRKRMEDMGWSEEKGYRRGYGMYSEHEKKKEFTPEEDRIRNHRQYADKMKALQIRSPEYEGWFHISKHSRLGPQSAARTAIEDLLVGRTPNNARADDGWSATMGDQTVDSYSSRQVLLSSIRNQGIAPVGGIFSEQERWNAQNQMLDEWGRGIFGDLKQQPYLPEQLQSEPPSRVVQVHLGNVGDAWKALQQTLEKVPESLREKLPCSALSEVPRTPSAWKRINTNAAGSEIYVSRAERARHAAPIYTGNCNSLPGQRLDRTRARALAQAHDLHPEFDWPPLWVPKQNHPLWFGVDSEGAPGGMDDKMLNGLLAGCTYGGKPMTADHWASDKPGTLYRADAMASEDLVGPMQAQKNQNSWMAKTKCLAQPLAMLWDVRNASGARDVWTSLDRIRGGADVFVRDSAGSQDKVLQAPSWNEMAWSPHTRWHAEQIWDVCERAHGCWMEIAELLQSAAPEDPNREELQNAQQVFYRNAQLFTEWTNDQLQRTDLCVWEVAINVVHAYEGIALLTSGQKALRNARVPIAEYGLNSAQLGRHLSPGERYVSYVGRNQPTCWGPDGEDSALYAVDEDAGFGEIGYGARVGEGPAARRPPPGQADGRSAQERAHTLAWWRWKWNSDSADGDQFVAGYAKKFNHNASLAMGGSDPYGVANFSQVARKTMLQYASREIARNEAQFGRQLQLSAGVKAQTVEEIEREGIDPKGKNMGIQDELAPGAITRKRSEDGRSFVREYDQATGSGGFYGTWFVPTGSDSLEWSRGVRLFLRRDEYGDLYLPQHVDLQYLKPKKTESGEETKWTEESFWREILLSMASDDATKARLQQSSAELLTPGVARRAIEEQLKNNPAMTGGARKQFYPGDYSKANEGYLKTTLDESDRQKALGDDERRNKRNTTYESYKNRRPKLFHLEVVPGSLDKSGRVRIGSALGDAKMTAVFPITVLKAAINSSTLHLSDELKEVLNTSDDANSVRKQLRKHFEAIFGSRRRFGELERSSEQGARLPDASGSMRGGWEPAEQEDDGWPAPWVQSLITSGEAGLAVMRRLSTFFSRTSMQAVGVRIDTRGPIQQRSIAQYVMQLPNLWMRNNNTKEERIVDSDGIPENPLRTLRDAEGTIAGPWGEAVLSAAYPVLASTGEQAGMLGGQRMVDVSNPVVDSQQPGSSSASHSEMVAELEVFYKRAELAEDKRQATNQAIIEFLNSLNARTPLTGWNAESAAAELEKLTRTPEGVAIVPSGIEDRTDEAVEALVSSGREAEAEQVRNDGAAALAQYAASMQSEPHNDVASREPPPL